MSESERSDSCRPAPMPPLSDASEPGNIVTGLLDLRFRTIITTRMMPTIYVLIMVLAAMLCAFLTVDAFFDSWAKGLTWLVLLDPVIFGAIVVAARMVLELILAVFALLIRMEQMGELVGHLSGTVEGVATNMPRVPFRRSWTLLRETMQETMHASSNKPGAGAGRFGSATNKGKADGNTDTAEAGGGSES